MQHVEQQLLGISLDDLTVIRTEPTQSKRRKFHLWNISNLATLAALVGALYLIVFDTGSSLASIASLVGVASSPVAAFVVTKYIAVVLIAGAVFSFYHQLRKQISQSHNWNTICPTCGPATLKMVHRTLGQRLLARVLRLPLRSFMCTGCDWRGTRVDRARL